MTNRSSAAHDAAAKEGQPGNSDDPNTARESRSGTGGADGHEAVPFATRRGSDPEPADDPAPVRRPVTADAPDPAPGQPKGPGDKAAQKSAPPAGKFLLSLG